MITRRLCWVTVTAGLLLSAGHAALGQERTVQAMAPWQGSGEVFLVAPGKLMILARFTGIMYLQGQQGPLDGAVMHCPVVQYLDIKLRRAEANGHCTFTDADNDMAYSTLTCTGAQGTCEGEFTFTGGTGKFAAIAGGGRLTVRAALAETAASLSSDGGIVSGAMGMTVWPALKYTTSVK